MDDAKGQESGQQSGQPIGRQSGHLMLITPERVFYAGLLGRPRERCPGAFHVYVALQGGLWLTTADGVEASGELLVVAPNVLHTIASEYRAAICLVIEPETIRPGAFEEMVKRLSGPESPAFARRIRQAYVELRQRHGGDDISSAEFDTMCFGEALPARALDPRVARAMLQIGKFSGEPLTAASCAAEAALSPSRFLHLFKAETGVPLRRYRIWNRIGAASRAIAEGRTLTEAAHGAGFASSAHFSTAFRDMFGMMPSELFAALRSDAPIHA